MHGWFQRKPRGLLRTLFRLPIYLYRLNLGWLLGRRFLLVTHQGRRTLLLHQTVLEVLHFDERTQTATVLSALGERADWYRNLQAHPPLEVQVGRLRFVPEFSVLTPDEAEGAWQAFVRAHTFEARLAPRILGWEKGGGEAARRDRAASLRLVAFRPKTTTTAPLADAAMKTSN